MQGESRGRMQLHAASCRTKFLLLISLQFQLNNTRSTRLGSVLRSHDEPTVTQKNVTKEVSVSS